MFRWSGFLVCAVLALASSCLGGQNPVAEAAGDPPLLRITSVIEVTDGSTFYMQPIWSPDGRRLAFTRSSFGGVYVRNSDGSGPIKEITSAAFSGYKPVWTSDSEAIVLRTRTGVVGQSITIADVETGEITTLVERAAHPGQPTRNADGDITVVLDGGKRVLDRETGTLEPPDEYYSGGGSRPLDVSLEMDYRHNRMWVIERDGTTRTEFPHEVLLANLSPAKDQVLVRLPDGWYVSRFDGSGMVDLGPGARWDWSPDGNRLVYLGDIEEDEWTVTGAELFVVNADGTGLTQLTHTPDQVEDYPVWSPDATRIAYSTVHSGKILVAILEKDQ
jgi:dipeptidyl aminopeptidase/acylaminoacyl peptidase